MPRNGSGSYSLPAGNPVETGKTISSTVQNNTTSDIAAALTASIANDGQTVPVANLPMGGFKHTGVAVAVSGTDYARWDQVLPVAGGNITPGNLGIGATVPAGRLHVNGSVVFGGGNAGPYHVLSLDGSNNLVSNAWNGHIWQTGGTQRLALNGSGNLGVGIDASATFRVDAFGGYLRLRSNTTIDANASGTVNALHLQSAGGTGEHAIIAGGSTATNFLTFYTANSAAPVERLRIRPDGSLWSDGNTQPIFHCRAWVNFNGTGTPAINASRNVSSITDNGTGHYTVNFATAMIDANYATALSARAVNNSSNVSAAVFEKFSPAVRSTTQLSIQVGDNTVGYVDSDIVCVSVFR